MLQIWDAREAFIKWRREVSRSIETQSNENRTKLDISFQPTIEGEGERVSLVVLSISYVGANNKHHSFMLEQINQTGGIRSS